MVNFLHVKIQKIGLLKSLKHNNQETESAERVFGLLGS